MVDFLVWANGSPSKRSVWQWEERQALLPGSLLLWNCASSNRHSCLKSAPSQLKLDHTNTSFLGLLARDPAYSCFSTYLVCTTVNSPFIESLQLNLPEAIFSLPRSWEASPLLYYFNIWHVFIISIQHENNKRKIIAIEISSWVIFSCKSQTLSGENWSPLACSSSCLALIWFHQWVPMLPTWQPHRQLNERQGPSLGSLCNVHGPWVVREI